jgi:hypothetical protein
MAGVTQWRFGASDPLLKIKNIMFPSFKKI